MTLYGLEVTFRYKCFTEKYVIVLRQLYASDEAARLDAPEAIEKAIKKNESRGPAFEFDSEQTTFAVLDFETP